MALLRLAIGLSVERKVGKASPVLECLIDSVDMVDKLQMVELDTMFDYCCMKKEGCSCSDKPTQLGLKMIHRLRVDLHRLTFLLGHLCAFHKFLDAIPYLLYSLIVVDDSVDVNCQSEKKYVNSFDVTVLRTVKGGNTQTVMLPSEEEQAELKLLSKLGLGGKPNNTLRRDKRLFELKPVPSTSW
ncbi:hypothetical protein Tco_0803035 [Tanacetum coccineum]|uniref:Uncharacterized protein n=1 Tax=Tanacetum coccineum TaxID=301880 RepID=A0ABQ5A429_9ASTR